MLNLKPQSLYDDEIRPGVEFAERFLDKQETLMRRFWGEYYDKSKKPDKVVFYNQAFEYLSIMLPQVCYGVPRVMATATDPSMSADPMRAGGAAARTSMADVAEGIRWSLNFWAEDDQVDEVLLELAHDFFFFASIAIVTTEDQPGYNAYEALVPQRPYLMKLSKWHYGVDRFAKTLDVYSHRGPRLKWHMWRADKEDLLSDPEFNREAVRNLLADEDIEKYHMPGKIEQRSPGEGSQPAPRRGEIVAYDVWVPEDNEGNEEGEHGKIHTIALGMSGKAGSEGTTKRALAIRDPRPYQGPPWGPYVEGGAYKVDDSPYYLSPVVAFATLAEEYNAHRVQAAQDAAAYKRILLAAAGDAEDAKTLTNAEHGHAYALKNPDAAREQTYGGMARETAEFLPQARQWVQEGTGISEAMLGSPLKGITATAEQRATSGTGARTAYLQKRYKKFVTHVFKSASWFQFYNEDQIYRGLGPKAALAGISEYRGGIFPGQEEFSWHDLRLKIEPYSLEYSDSALIQKRMMDAFGLLAQTAPLLLQAPFIDWKEMLNRTFEVMNFGSSDELVLDDVLDQFLGMELSALTAGGQQPSLTIGNTGGGGKPPVNVEGSSTAAARELGQQRGRAVAMG